MKLKEIGEFGFIERIRPLFNNLLQTGQTGIGDDCALISSGDKEDLLITTDMLIEDVHFIRNAITPFQLGYKSLAVNLSDIAAMGGIPIGSFLSLAIPPDTDVEYLDSFIDGYRQLSAKYNTPLLGGDTTKSIKHLAINVSVLGKSPKGKARTRNAAKVGDAVCVTGFLGNSAGGLQVLLQDLPSTKEHNYLVKCHHQPEPRIREGLFLASHDSVHAMMDISDGIASDLGHILKASSVGAIVDLGMLPLSPELIQVSEKFGWNIFELAAAGGEDYELLVTVEADRLEHLQREFFELFGRRLVKIGHITADAYEVSWYYRTLKVDKPGQGFNHFN